MKKIIVGIFAFTLLFLGGKSVLASSVWNGDINDCPSINIANYTHNEGYGNPCWNGTSVSADAGDAINVRIYYHNTSSATATNTRIKISAPTGSSTSHSFTGQIISDQGSLSTGSVRVNISSSQSLTLSSVKWYPNQSSSAQTPSGSITSSGVSIGNIAPGWDSQGTVVAVFRISNNVPVELCEDSSANNYGNSLPCTYTTVNPSGEISSNPKTCKITEGNSSCIVGVSWYTNNAIGTSVVKKYNGEILANANSGSRTFSLPYGSTSVGLYNNGKLLDTASVFAVCESDTTWNGSYCKKNVIIEYCKDTFANNYGSPLPCTYKQIDPTGNISASPSSCQISSGNSSCTSTLNWYTNNPVGSSAVTKSGSTIATGNSGSKNVSVSYGSSTYYLYNNSKELSRASVSASCEYGTNWNGSYCAGSVIEDKACYILSFYTGNSYITKGESTELIWNTKDCVSVSISNIGNVAPVASKHESPKNTTTYTISARGSNGEIKTKTLTINVSENYENDNNCSVSNFYASDTSIEEGDSVKLSWNTNDCDYVKITDLGNVSDDDSDYVYPDSDTTYTLTAYDSGFSKITRTVRIYVDENNDDNDDDNCSISSFTASDTSIDEGDSVKLKWNTNDCDYVKITDLGNVSDDGSDYVYPDSDTTYKITAYDSSSAKHTKSVSISVDENNDNNNDVIYNTSVVTTIATNVTETGATLNGLVTTNVKNNTNTYFEYGPTQNLGFRTSSKSISGSSYINQYVSGLNPNTVYYFRAVSENGTGTTKGATSIFQTLSSNINYNTNTQTTKYVYVGGTTVTGSSSPIMLTIENKYSYIGRGDVIDYTIYYKNIGKSTLENSVLQVIVPEYITITNSSDGTYSNDTHALSVELGDLKAGEDGTVYMQGVVKSIPSNLAKVVSTAVLVYTNKSGAQENAMAYVLNMPNRNNSNLGASAFFSGFLGLGLIGWLIIIILILIIILIVRRLTEKRDENTTHNA